MLLTEGSAYVYMGRILPPHFGVALGGSDLYVPSNVLAKSEREGEGGLAGSVGCAVLHAYAKIELTQVSSWAVDAPFILISAVDVRCTFPYACSSKKPSLLPDERPSQLLALRQVPHPISHTDATFVLTCMLTHVNTKMLL